MQEQKDSGKPIASKQLHPSFPTREQVVQDGTVAYSDHLPILVTVPNMDLQIISLNILGAISFSGIHSYGYQEPPEITKARYTRIADGLKASASYNNAGMILLQECSPEMVEILKEKLGEGWNIDSSDYGLISCYKTELNCTAAAVNHQQANGIYHLSLYDNTLHVYNISGGFDETPEKHEDMFRSLFDANPEACSVIIGDTNSRIAPIDNIPSNITTGVVPASFNRGYGLGFDAQVSDFPDGAFYRNFDGRISQLPIQTLDFANGTVTRDDRKSQERPKTAEFRMVMCLDDHYQATNLIGGKTLFEYQQSLQAKEGGILVRMSATDSNEKAIGIRFSQESSFYQALKKKLQVVDEHGVSTKDRLKMQLVEHEFQRNNFLFVPVEHAEQLHQLIAPYLLEEQQTLGDTDYSPSSTKKNIGILTTGIFGSAAIGAGIGAAIGTFVFPGIGTAAGALIGAMFGAGAGMLATGWQGIMRSQLVGGKKPMPERVGAGILATLGAAGIGALLGTFVFPGIGTLIGAAIGAGFGAVTSGIIGGVTHSRSQPVERDKGERTPLLGQKDALEAAKLNSPAFIASALGVTKSTDTLSRSDNPVRHEDPPVASPVAAAAVDPSGSELTGSNSPRPS